MNEGTLYTVGEIAAQLTATGVPHATARARVTGYAKHSMIVIRERGKGNTSPHRYGVADVAMSAILSALQDMGVADRETLRFVAASCYEWPTNNAFHDFQDRVRGIPAPITGAMLVTELGEYSAFFLDLYRNPMTGQRRMFAHIAQAYLPDWNAVDLDPLNWIPVATISVPLPDLFAPVLANAVRLASKASTG